VLDKAEFPIVLQCVGYLSLDHCFLHSLTPSICLPYLEVDPEVGIRRIYPDNLNQSPVWVAAVNMQWPSGASKSQDQATGAILVIGIILDYLVSCQYCLFQFRHTDIPMIVWSTACFENSY
jgi:hypothetical protein